MDANIAYYCLHELHWEPNRYISLSIKEKAFVAAAVDIKIEAEKKKQKELERAGRRRR